MVMVRLSTFSSPVSCPLGLVSVAECKGRVLAVSFGDVSALLEQNRRLGEFSCARTEGGSAARELARFLAEPIGPLRVKVDLSLIPGDFDREVLRALFQTRPGTTLTYADLAARVGRPHAARAVGGTMRRNPIPIAIPCHRVLPRGGGIGNYTGGVDKKAWLLAREGAFLE